MEMRVSRERRAYVITLAGRWDTFSSLAFEQKAKALTEEGMRMVVIDLTDVDYVSSFGLRSLLNTGKLLEPLHGRIHVSSLQPQVRKVFVGSGFSSLFPEYPDVHTALRAFKDTD